MFPRVKSWSPLGIIQTLAFRLDSIIFFSYKYMHSHLFPKMGVHLFSSQNLARNLHQFGKPRFWFFEEKIVEGMYREVTGSGGFTYCYVFFVLVCICICIYIHIYMCIYIYLGKDWARELAAKIYGIVEIHAFASGVSVLQSQNSIDDPVLLVSFATFRWKETYLIEIREWDRVTLQMQQAVHATIYLYT